METTEQLTEILNDLLPGFKYIKLPHHDGLAVEWEGEKIAIFEDYKSAEKFNDKQFWYYFNRNPQQIIYLWEAYHTEIEKDNWKNFVNTKKLGGWLVRRFDHFTKGRYKSSPYRDRILAEIIDSPLEHLILYVEGDIAKLSIQLRDFLDMRGLTTELQDAMESRVYEHGGYYMLPLIELPE